MKLLSCALHDKTDSPHKWTIITKSNTNCRAVCYQQEVIIIFSAPILRERSYALLYSEKKITEERGNVKFHSQCKIVICALLDKSENRKKSLSVV